jgi:hypothetical protein
MARRATKLLAAVLGAVGCSTVLGAIAIAVALASFSFSLGSCEGLDFSYDREPLAITRALDGTIAATTGPCVGEAPVQSVELRRDGEVVWAARAPADTPLRAVTVGQAPEGFTEDMPLTEVLRDGQAYQLIWKSQAVVQAFPAPTEGQPDPSLVFANVGTFRPEQVGVGQVLFRGHEQPLADFARRTCTR